MSMNPSESSHSSHSSYNKQNYQNNQNYQTGAFQALLEAVITSETTSVIRLVWFVIEQTQRGQRETEASYSELQRQLKLSRCGVHSGVSRALEAGYLRRAGVGSHSRARYALNWPLHQEEYASSRTQNPSNPQFENEVALGSRHEVFSVVEDVEDSNEAVREAGHEHVL